MTAARPIVMKNIAVAGLKIKMSASKTARYKMDTLLGGCMMTGEVQETTESTGTLQEGKDMDKNQLPDGFMREKEIEVAVEEMKEADLEQDFLPEGWNTQELMKLRPAWSKPLAELILRMIRRLIQYQLGNNRLHSKDGRKKSRSGAKQEEDQRERLKCC